MLSDFAAYFAQNLSFLQGKKLLLAVSGGIDSMVMADLFLKANQSIALAHCNFKLRGKESDADQQFVTDFANKHNISVFTTDFDTQQFAQDYKLSTQVAARKLRYEWFSELLQRENYDFVLTAHHADDNLETFLINLSRGTGIEGLTGIPKQNDKIVRPLLDYSREEIAAYAQANDIQWREDASNASDQYLRNQVRQAIVPQLKKLDRDFLSAFQKTQQYLHQAQTLAEDAAIMVYQQVAQPADEEIHFNLQKLKKLPNFQAYLYRWLREFGFTAWDDVYALADSQTGKQVFAAEYRLLRNRDFLILSPLKAESLPESHLIPSPDTDVNFPIKLLFSQADNTTNAANNVIFVDAEKMQFPLVLRKFREGDVFQPLGMNGQSKKVSKFFKDEKLSLIQKEKTWLLCSGEKIVWIVGIRPDERFKVTETTKQILQITQPTQ